MSSSSEIEGTVSKGTARDTASSTDEEPNIVVEQTELDSRADDPMHVVGEFVLGRYRVVRLIDQGGQGVVYEAAHERLKRAVAIKFLQVEATDRSTALKRFEREAEILAKLSHPSIVQVYDIATHTDGETPLMVMEFVRGESLTARLQDRRRTPWQDAFKLAAQAADALAAAHAHDIIHRDIKPDNLIVCEDGTLKVLDFGIAQLITELSNTEDGHGPKHRLTDMNVVLGTAGYMSPEQFSGIHLDGRSDVYSLGVVLYRLISAKRLWASVERHQIAQLAQTTDPADLRTHVPELPEHAALLVRRSIERDRNRRFQTMDDMRVALLASLDSGVIPKPIRGRQKEGGSSSAATLITETRQTVLPGRPMRRLIIIGLAIAALAGGTSWLFAYRANHHTTEPPEPSPASTSLTSATISHGAELPENRPQTAPTSEAKSAPVGAPALIAATDLPSALPVPNPPAAEKSHTKAEASQHRHDGARKTHDARKTDTGDADTPIDPFNEKKAKK
jgi:serine/threonine protein kinase